MVMQDIQISNVQLSQRKSSLTRSLRKHLGIIPMCWIKMYIICFYEMNFNASWSIKNKTCICSMINDKFR